MLYKELPFPWVSTGAQSAEIKISLTQRTTRNSQPFTDRYVFVVQDYFRVREADGSSWILCYNHDVEHEYFSQREGFQRAKMRFQGLVGEAMPSSESSATKVKTRLTWFVCCDFGGLVPTVAVQSLLLTSMFYPRQTMLELEQRLGRGRLEDGEGEVGSEENSKSNSMLEDEVEGLRVKMQVLLQDYQELEAKSKKEAERLEATIRDLRGKLKAE